MMAVLRDHITKHNHLKLADLGHDLTTPPTTARPGEGHGTPGDGGEAPPDPPEIDPNEAQMLEQLGYIDDR